MVESIATVLYDMQDPNNMNIEKYMMHIKDLRCFSTPVCIWLGQNTWLTKVAFPLILATKMWDTGIWFCLVKCK